ncbi:hypothetical protein B0H15DRAFT_852012 [Mycena belliarum]|uniref:F-box domain-containing protein n=1 Tax=Mycena belliarum TaxID=1033014 RepID=A0AAD6TZF3_9AGAR|nr:hypothetical protein B0H15DRAFT_852012 [Mycena belliae]
MAAQLPQLVFGLPNSDGTGSSSSSLLNCPVDCVVEVLALLTPGDILHLARTSKHLRAFLLSKRQRYIWKESFLNLEGPRLPACPPGLSEPQYANLVFSCHCHSCFKVHNYVVDWDLRVRYCSKCKRDHTRKFNKENPPKLSCDPGVDVQKLISIRPPTMGPAFLYTDLGVATRTYEALDPEARLKYLVSSNRALVDRRIHARECRAWVDEIARQAALAREALKSERVQAIHDRLEALGWSEELRANTLCPHGSLATQYNAIAGKYEALTDLGWVVVKPRLEALLTEVRRLESVRKASLAESARRAAELLKLSPREQRAAAQREHRSWIEYLKGQRKTGKTPPY